ncbi:MAG: trypsin-like serine peptidase [Aureliella sp.]
MKDNDKFAVVEAPYALTDAEARDVEAYWTEERIRSAEPLPLPTIEGEPPVTAVAGGAREPVVHDEVAPQRETLPTEAAPCFVTIRAANINVSPFAYVGKLYMTFGGSNYVGSAQCICKYSILTAGHCVYDRAKGWATNVVFKGRFSNGSQAGTWAIQRLAAPKGWTDSQDHAYDLGVGISTGNIQSVMGSAGWLANGPANQGNIKSIGYPAQPISGYNFDGKYMWQCDGRYLSGTTILKMCNNMTGGCSGGMWDVIYNGQHRVNGVNSHRYTSDPNSLYSPYFGQGFLNLIDWLRQNSGC